ncbi:centrosomal protein of 162 kDa isoform X2 [Pygocentrus nattereri]|uniref:centrosomal protein of 162 kDa isoform X2 n=1 Tax=Pygocentrus nattereri TaxID=42514 RepID=UPI0008142A03|nr:centrosomal protein of 162 kDa isoform X2 [Pygocentrus nattereri]
MAYRMTKEELDQQFEQFLRESVSDDSIELGGKSVRPSVLDQLGKVPEKQVKKSHVPVPWWQDDEDSEEALGKVVPTKPTPKPRSKALDMASHLDKMCLPNQETSFNADRQRGSEHIVAKPKSHPSKEHSYSEEIGASEDGFLAESSSPFTPENSHCAPRQSSVILIDSDNASTVSSDADSSSSDNGAMDPAKTFRKSLRKSQPIKEVDEEQLKEHSFENKSKGDTLIFSRDSLEPEDSVLAFGSARNAAGLSLNDGEGEEEEEKARFFAYLDKRTESQGDDPKLDKKQESSGSTFNSPQRGGAVSLTKQDQSEDGERVSVKNNSAASPAYSEDFEDETSPKEFEEKKPERCGMLAKVSLHDSLNSTDGAQVHALANNAAERTEYLHARMAKAAGEGNTGQSYGQSGASEMEALQEAYRQISHSVGECEEKVQEPSRSPASPATPECSRGTFKHLSTAESDLPTAEELMRAIGPDSGFMYGLSLQPLREATGGAERMASESSPVRAKSEDPAGEITGAVKENPAVMEPHLASPHNRQSSIAEEVKRLMQEQEDCQGQHPSVSSKGRKQKVSGRSTTTASSSFASRKAPVPSVRTKRAEIRPLPKASAPNRTGHAAKPPSALVQKNSQNTTTTEAPALSQAHTVKGPDSGLRLSNELIASVQSFAAFLQHQMSELSTGCTDRSDSSTQQVNRTELVKDVPAGSGPDLPSERSSLECLRLQLAQRARQLLLREEQLQQDHSREISALRQENYMLHSKLCSVEEASKNQRWSFGKASDPVTEEKLRLIEKEMKEQETLIQGYQLENEKLCMQVKTLQAQSKQHEEAMFTENQRLLSELAFTKEQLNRNSKQKTVGSVAASDQGYGVTELMAQVHAAQRRELQLQEEIHKLKQEKQALQVDLHVIKKERDLAKTQVMYASGDKGFELKLLEERHKEEVSVLKKRLQWYAENQQLLDKDAARLRVANAETQRLTEQVEKLKMEVAKRTNQQRKKAQERAGEARRIQDLQRQVKEMEDILRRRHPNSLPALIYAAAAAGGEEGRSSCQHTAPQPSQTTALLERRIHRLEAELEGRDEEAKRSLRAMEQQFQRIKLQYEQQISELEQRLAERSQEHQGDLSQDSGTQAEPLQEELRKLREAHQCQVNALRAEVASLQEQVSQALPSAEVEKPSRSPSRHQRQAEAAQSARIERLTQELSTKSRTIQELHRTVERLQRERRTMLSAPRVEGSSTKPKQHHSDPAKDPFSVPAETFPPTQDEKYYQPKAFSGSHITEVQQDNDRLRLRQEQLELQWEQERIALQAAATQARNELHKDQEHSMEQLAVLKAEHQREMEHLVARHALEHSSSKVTELTNQLKTQEIMVLHLREQVKELQSTKDSLAVSKIREETLQNQLAKLLEELKQAKEAHSPELRHFASLEHKIHSMERRYNQREQELQQMITQTRSVVEQEQQAEVARWKKLAQGKGSELEAFRLELDSILDVLRELQRQGVVIPASQHASPLGIVFRPLRS